MKLLGFLFIFPLIKLLSWLPMRVLYVISDFVFFILYYVVRYRKELVLSNLQRSFPDKELSELKIIHRKYYHFLSDLFLEVVKSLSISKAEVKTRFRLYNVAPLEKDWENGENVMIVLGHSGNWEWGAQIFGYEFSGRVIAPYAPLKNKYLSRVMEKNRSRSGLTALPKKTLIPYLNEHQDEQRFLLLIADQSPNPNNFHMVNFLNQETATVKGMESIARRTGFKVYYASMQCHKRGYYSATFQLLEENIEATKEGSLTAAFFKALEKDIVNDPVHYLWSHNRWKLTTNRKVRIVDSSM